MQQFWNENYDHSYDGYVSVTIHRGRDLGTFIHIYFSLTTTVIAIPIRPVCKAKWRTNDPPLVEYPTRPSK